VWTYQRIHSWREHKETSRFAEHKNVPEVSCVKDAVDIQRWTRPGGGEVFCLRYLNSPAAIFNTSHWPNVCCFYSCVRMGSVITSTYFIIFIFINLELKSFLTSISSWDRASLSIGWHTCFLFRKSSAGIWPHRAYPLWEFCALSP
jgi:hypothetical protein